MANCSYLVRPIILFAIAVEEIKMTKKKDSKSQWVTLPGPAILKCAA